MAENNKIDFRSNKIGLFKQIAEARHITISNLIREMTDYYMLNFKFSKEISKEMINRNKIMDLRNKNTASRNEGYQLSNSMSYILKIASASYFSSGDINMNPIIKEIENKEKQYELFSDESKEMFKEDIETLKSFKNKAKLLHKIKENISTNIKAKQLN